MTYPARPLYLYIPKVITPEVKEAMDSFLTPWLAKHELPTEFQLYHYTTLDGMQGIVRDRALWFGHASSLNDPLEIQYGQNIIAEVMNDASERENRKDVRKFLRGLLAWTQAFDTGLYHIFVACFCESGNLLSQWRGYTNREGGYCLGFKFSTATRIVLDVEKLAQGKPPFLRKVSYDEDEQKALIQQYLDGVIEGVKRALDKGTATQHEGSELSMEFQATNVLLDMLLSFKHPAFREEKEWRLIQVTRTDEEPKYLRFKETANGLFPYRPTHIYDVEKNHSPKFPLHSIIFGPTLEPLRTRSAIELLLHHIAADEHRITLTPYPGEIKWAGYSLRQ